MKATFKNIGPIKEAELELGDLTIIAGQNNTGKTYLAYTLYGFLQFWNNGFPVHRRIKYSKKINEKIKEIAQQIEKTGAASMELDEYKGIRRWLVSEIYKFFSSEIIHQVFSSSKSEFEDVYFQLQLQENDQIIEKEVSIRSDRDKIIFKAFVKDENLIFEIEGPEDIERYAIVRGIYTLLEKTIRSDYLDPWIFSAERFGISLFYKELDFTKNRLVEELQNLSEDKKFDPFRFIRKQSARYAKPIKDNIDYTRDLLNIQKQKSELEDDGVSWIKKMIGGSYKVVKDEIRFISTARRKNKFNIPLHLASSSVRGLSDLYFYLKHIAVPGQLLIIDEPESHLSPKNQILMARLLLFCVNQGIKVLITTHSDYIIREINNLIMLHGDFDKKDEFLEGHKKDYTEDDHLNPESVRAYICEEGGLTRCNIDEQGIDGMTVFDEAIDGINQISAKLAYMNMDGSEDD